MEKRRVLVTGATGALGSEIVQALSMQFQVVACYQKSEERAQILQQEAGCEILCANIACETEVESLFTTPLWAVVHAAGIARDALLMRQSIDSWNETLRINVDGAFLLTRAALQHLPEGGRLILFASRVGERGAAGQAAYAASKAATIALGKVAAREGAVSGIAVNIICPPFVPSAMSDGLSLDKIESLRRQSVWNCEGSGHEVIGAVKWLLSEDAKAISGQVIHCDARL